ncbi:MAG: hypothetical protein K2W82_18080 [Candidatus Obscuribacterales bacterium]|nr:hypothetical protein [Candidatus Obscuribacterales bacterium]
MRTVQFLFVAFVFSFFISNACFAQKPAPLQQIGPVGKIQDVTDPSKNEESHINVVVNGKVMQENITYKDQHMKAIDYREDGTVYAITELMDGNLSLTNYRKDGKGKTKCMQILFNKTTGKREMAHTIYHEDGETPALIQEESVASYFNSKGKLTFKKSGEDPSTEVTVYDDSGNLAYKQTWLEAIDGPYLTTVEEVTAKGVRRRLYFRGTVKKVEYLKADGSVERSEEVQKGTLELEEPVAPERQKPVTLPTIKEPANE